VRTIFGRSVCETITELTHPRSTALIVVDMQNDYLAPGGVDCHRGEFAEALARGIVTNTARVVARARTLGVLVIFLRYARRADHRFEAPSTLRWIFVKRGYDPTVQSTVEGSWGWEILPELAPCVSDIVIDKRRPSGFFGTALDATLKARGIQTTIFAGVSTHGCVEASARDAELRDYYVVLLENCLGAYSEALHQAALTVMRSRYDVLDSHSLMKVWRDAAPPGA